MCFQGGLRALLLASSFAVILAGESVHGTIVRSPVCARVCDDFILLFLLNPASSNQHDASQRFQKVCCHSVLLSHLNAQRAHSRK